MSISDVGYIADIKIDADAHLCASWTSDWVSADAYNLRYIYKNTDVILGPIMVDFFQDYAVSWGLGKLFDLDLEGHNLALLARNTIPVHKELSPRSQRTSCCSQ